MIIYLIIFWYFRTYCHASGGHLCALPRTILINADHMDGLLFYRSRNLVQHFPPPLPSLCLPDLYLCLLTISWVFYVHILPPIIHTSDSEISVSGRWALLLMIKLSLMPTPDLARRRERKLIWVRASQSEPWWAAKKCCLHLPLPAFKQNPPYWPATDICCRMQGPREMYG